MPASNFAQKTQSAAQQSNGYSQTSTFGSDESIRRNNV
jgi:hypothetical protein